MVDLPSRSDLERFRTVVGQKLGLQVEDGRLDQLADVLRQRLAAGKYPHPQAYLDRLAAVERATDETRALAEQLTVSETFFFRNSDHFRALAEVVLPERIRAQASTRRLRLLSAGCASGEEPYSLAIMVREALPDLASWDVKITGIDINPANLARAERARYGPWSLRATTDEARRRSFRQEGKDFLLDPAIRQMVTFEERNLADEDPRYWQSRGCDAVFCRNVIMYFRPEVMVDVVRRLGQATLPGGFLFLGHAETLRGLSLDFHLRHTHDTFYYQRLEVWERPPATTPAMDGAAAPATDGAYSWVEAISRASERITSLTERRDRATIDVRARATGAPVSAVPAPAPGPAAPSQAGRLSAVLESIRQERFGAARALLTALPTETHSSPDAQLLSAVLLTNEGKLAEAEATCRQLLLADELNAGAHYLMALAREHEGDDATAITHDQTAVYLDPLFAMPHLHLGLVLRRRGDHPAALPELRQAMALLGREDASRVLLFGGGFSREALIELCRRELEAATRATGEA